MWEKNKFNELKEQPFYLKRIYHAFFFLSNCFETGPFSVSGTSQKQGKTFVVISLLIAVFHVFSFSGLH